MMTTLLQDPASRPPDGPPGLIETKTAEAVHAAEGWWDKFWNAHIFQKLTVGDVIVIAAVVLAAWVISLIVQSTITRAFQRRAVTDHGGQTVIKRLVHYLIMIGGVFVGLNLVGLSLTSLFAAGAVFAVVIGFALQNLSENFVSGVILMVERSITPEDVLEVEGRVVRVVKMGIRATVARTRDDEDVIIPNSLLVTSTVKNYTLRDSLYRVRTVVGVTYSSDMAHVRQVLEATARDFAGREMSKDPRVLMTDFGASSVNFEVSVWIEDPWRSRQLISKLNEAIWNAFKQAKIAFAYPQLDLHVDPELLTALQSARRD
jgi:small-conductance mechanosensitive channel